MPTITAILAYILDAVFTVSCLGLPAARMGNPAVGSVKEMFRPMALSESMILVDPQGWSREDIDVLVCLQGVTARDGTADIYIVQGNYNAYPEAYRAARPAQGFEEFSGTVWDLAARFAERISDRGYCVYGDPDPGVNMAATVAAAEGWLGVPAGCAEKAEAAGLRLMRDLREMEGSPARQQRCLFREYKDKLNRAVVVHQPPGNSNLRDFAIAQRAFCFYVPGDSGGSAREYLREQRLLLRVAGWLKPNACVFGVWGAAGETPFVKKLSRAGLVVLPADHLRNGSALMGFEVNGEIKQPYVNREIEARAGKHYAALMLSDGDNLQWLVGDAFFRGLIYDRLQSGDDFPLSLTYGPLMAALFPFAAGYHYGLPGPGVQMICGVSGLGYTNVSLVSPSARKSYARLTAEAMRAADLRVMQLLDNVNDSLVFSRKAGRAVNEFAAQEAIAGGIWYQDPDKYESGGGRVYRACNGKLWMCNRISFWSPDGTPDTVTDEWIQGIADTINGYPRDPGDAVGYSVVNVHPWSIGYADLRRLVELLDEDVVLVTAEELVKVAGERLG